MDADSYWDPAVRCRWREDGVYVGRPVHGLFRFSASPLIPLLALLLAGCVFDVRPVEKIGLLAPFEGLYRRSGYDALAALRAAITDHPGAAAGFLPLALDDGADADHSRRAAQKLLADPQVVAVLGPLFPSSAVATDAILSRAGTLWFPGFLPPGQALSAPADGVSPAWFDELLEGVGRMAMRQGAAILVVSGLPEGLPPRYADQWASVAGLPVRVTDDPAAVPEDSAVLWLGTPDGAVAFYTALRARLDDVPLWMGPWGSDPVFFERAGSSHHVYWVTWTDARYARWAETHAPNTPAAYLLYRAAEEVLLRVAGEFPSTEAPPAWYLQAYALQPDGSSIPYSPGP